MADFTALKTAIQTYIKQNGNEEINGEKLQEILLSVVTTLGDSAINDLVTALNDEVAARQNADGTLQQNITNEATARGNADTALSNRLGSTITAENTAADQIGAEAEARAAVDTALQELIDGITDNIENGYVYAGIATPSSTPASGKVFYLALTAGTYTNFGNTEVSQGINILKYNGTAWSLDAFIGIDDKLTPGSNNIPKSGNVLENIIKNGSAFDLSAYNAVDGVLATYADLDAALTALNALPAVYKQGGMSMKFVLTSDNKYVEYRLMSQTFSTDEADWQGVDDEPTAGSHNLVESGGEKKAFGNITYYDSIVDYSAQGYNRFILNGVSLYAQSTDIYLDVKNNTGLQLNVRLYYSDNDFDERTVTSTSELHKLQNANGYKKITAFFMVNAQPQGYVNITIVAKPSTYYDIIEKDLQNIKKANVVNNVTDGGAQKVLSADMGVRLGRSCIGDRKQVTIQSGGTYSLWDLICNRGDKVAVRVSGTYMQFGYYTYPSGYTRVSNELDKWVLFDVPSNATNLYIYNNSDSEAEFTVEILANQGAIDRVAIDNNSTDIAQHSEQITQNSTDIQKTEQTVGYFGVEKEILDGRSEYIISLIPYRNKNIAVKVTGTFTQFGYYDSSQQGYTVVSRVANTFVDFLVPNDATWLFVYNSTGSTTNVFVEILASLAYDVHNLNEGNVSVKNNIAGCVFMSLGDSITTESYYIGKLRDIIKPSKYYNLAVASATWADRPGTDSYDGNPSYSGDQNQNVLGNQVQKIINNLSDYDAPDVIIISAGTNDFNFNQTDLDDTYLETYFTNEGAAVPCTQPTFDAADTYSDKRKRIEGAMRYVCSTLQGLFPNAKIYILTPIQACLEQKSYKDNIKIKQELLTKVAKRMGIPVIHVGEECGIYQDFEYQGYYWDSSWATQSYPKNGRDLIDGLHPNTSGSTKMAKYIGRKLIENYEG